MFSELSETPQDIRGNSEGAEVEVPMDYAERVYGLTNRFSRELDLPVLCYSDCR